MLKPTTDLRFYEHVAECKSEEPLMSAGFWFGM
jgi:hypothetical protein